MPSSQPESQKPLAMLANLLWPYRGMLFIGMLAMFVNTVGMLWLPQHLKTLFDNALTTQDLTALTHVMQLIFAVALILVVGMFCRTYFIQYAASMMINDFRRKLFAHTISLDLTTFETRASGDLIARLLADVTEIRQFIQVGLPMLLRGGLLAVGAICALLYLNAWLTLYLFAAILPVVTLAMVLGKAWRKYSKEILATFAQLSDRVEEVINAIRTVKTTTQETTEAKNINVFMDSTLHLSRRLILSWASFGAFNILVGFISVIAVLYLGGREVILGNMSMGSMLAYLLYLAFLGDGASNVAGFWPVLNNVIAALERVFELLSEKPQITETTTPKPLPTLSKNQRALSLKNLTFSYATRPDDKALNAINLNIKAGETVAIVGPSGAGKSTLFSLLLRLYEAHKGSIKLDGINIKDLTFTDLRGAFATVSQDTHIFAGTVHDNITYASPNAQEPDVISAAKNANAHEFIMSLPNGYQTEVGAKGVRLSGGQKQRLAIARAMLQNAPILLLDEATSHLDAESENAVQTALENLQQNRTVLVVAHRLATVKNADRIILLNEGKITAEGTHTQLLKSAPLYKKLANLQFIAD